MMDFRLFLCVLACCWQRGYTALASAEFDLPPACQVYTCGTSGTPTCNTNGKCTGCGGTNPDDQCFDSAGAGCSGCIDPTTVGSGDVCVGTNCLCEPYYYGATCANKRLKLDCTAGNEMTITLMPYNYHDNADPTLITPFNGKIYVSLANDFSEARLNAFSPGGCIFTAGLENEKIASTESPCDLDTSATLGESNLYAYIQHNPKYRSAQDQVVSFRCFAGTTGTPTSDLTVQTVQERDRAPIQSTVKDETISGYTAELKIKHGENSYSDISTSHLPVGTDLSLFIRSIDGNDFSVKSIWAANTVDGAYAERQQIFLFEDWCVPTEAAGVFNGPVIGKNADAGSFGGTDGEKMYRFDFDAFYFPGPSQVMALTALICDQATCDTGTVPTCTNTISPGKTALDGLFRRRRRRDVDIVSGVNATTTVYIQVGEPPSDQPKDSNTETTSDAECYKSTSVLLPIILLASLLLITMVMTFFFCMKVTRFQDQQQKMSHDNMSYKS